MYVGDGREAQQKLHLELTELKRDAALTQRELERVTHELDQVTLDAQVHAVNNTSLHPRHNKNIAFTAIVTTPPIQSVL